MKNLLWLIVGMVFGKFIIMPLIIKPEPPQVECHENESGGMLERIQMGCPSVGECPMMIGQ